MKPKKLNIHEMWELYLLLKPAIDNEVNFDEEIQKIIVASEAKNLVDDDTNDRRDIFIYDCDTGTTTRVSVQTGGAEVYRGDSHTPSINSAGIVAFASHAYDLAGGSNASREIFVHDLNTVTTTRITKTTFGLDPTDDSFSPSISVDGRYIAFESDAVNLVVNDSNVYRDIFLHDRDFDENGTFDETGVNDTNTTRISVNTSSNDADSNSFTPAISTDGTKVVFASDATDIITGDTNSKRDIFIHDLDTGITIRMSVDRNGSNSDNHSFAPSVNSDGSYVAFESIARDIVSGDTNNYRDIFVNTP